MFPLPPLVTPLPFTHAKFECILTLPNVLQVEVVFLEVCAFRSVTMGGKGCTISREPNHYGGSESTQGAPKGSSNVTSNLFNTVHLLPKDLSFEHGGANLPIDPGVI